MYPFFLKMGLYCFSAHFFFSITEFPFIFYMVGVASVMILILNKTEKTRDLGTYIKEKNKL